jgi:hypothetical protein
MAVDIRKVHARGAASMQAAYSEAMAEYQQAQLAEDVDGMAAAGMKMAALQATAEKFNNLAQEAMNPQRQQYQEPRDQFGLTADERAVAENSFGPVKIGRDEFVDLTKDEKARLYAENRAKMARMKSQGKIQ